MLARSRVAPGWIGLTLAIGLGLAFGSASPVHAVVRGQGDARGIAAGRATAPIAPTERMNDPDSGRPERTERPGEAGSAQPLGPPNNSSSDRKRQPARGAGCERQASEDIRNPVGKRRQPIGPKCRESGYDPE